MKTYREREDELFDRWMQKCAALDGINPEEDFAFDGILYRGEYKQIHGCWERQPGNETELWDMASCRLLVLTKDTTRSGGLEDMRIETARKNLPDARVEAAATPFYRNLTLWAYSLINAVSGGEIYSYNDSPDWEQLREFYTSLPIARVNCKKQIGESRIEDNVLRDHIERYSDLLMEQISMYDADIILCCGNQGGCSVIKDFVNKYYIPDLKQYSESGRVYYSEKTNKIVIDSYHPTFPKSFKDMEFYYEQMMTDLKEFLQCNPGFIR